MDAQEVEVVQQKSNSNQGEDFGFMAKAKDPVYKRMCPECGKYFMPSGLPGHLKFVHGLSQKKALVKAKEAAEEAISKVDQCFAIIERIKVLRERYTYIDSTRSDNNSFFADEDVSSKEMLDAIREEEQRLQDELMRLRGKRPKKTFWGTTEYVKDEGNPSDMKD